MKGRVSEVKGAREFLDNLGKNLGWKKAEDWYSLTHKEIRRFGGGKYLKAYKHSPSQLVISTYTEHQWNPWKFEQVPVDYWEKTIHQREYLDWLGNHLGFKSKEDWYQVNHKHFEENEGSSLLKKYHGGSPSLLVQSVYSDHDWIPWKFQHVHRGFWDNLENKRRFLLWLRKELMIKEMEDWYFVSWKQIQKVTSMTPIKQFGLVKLLEDVFPEHSWDTQRFHTHTKLIKATMRVLSVTLQEIFPDKRIQENFVLRGESSGREIGMDLYIESIGLGFELFERDEELRRICEEKDIKIVSIPHWWDRQKESLIKKIRFEKPEVLPQGVEGSIGGEEESSATATTTRQDEYRKFFDWLFTELKLSRMEDWYNVTRYQICKYGGWGLLRSYDNSIVKALETVYPEHKFHPWEFRSVAPFFWDSKDNQRKYMDWLGLKLGFKRMEDWYGITWKDLVDNRGSGLLSSKYGNSPSRLVRGTFDEHKWDSSRFSQVSRNFWNDPTNQREIFNKIGEKIGIKRMEDWYKVKQSDVVGMISGVIAQHDGSLIKALSTIFPEFNWQLWRFNQVPRGFWDDEKNKKDFLEWVGKELGLKNVEDWATVSSSQIGSLRGSYLVKKSGGMNQLLDNFLGSQTIEHSSTTGSSPTSLPYRSKAQGFLTNMIVGLFGEELVKSEFKHPQLIFSGSMREMEFDIWIDGETLAFEYQGEQHYQMNHLGSSLEDQQRRDNEKKKNCESCGITLISIPFWWDMKKSSLIATIYEKRPDVFLKYFPSEEIGVPIPETNPHFT